MEILSSSASSCCHAQGNTISIDTAARLAGLTKRTLWRRLASGALIRENQKDALGRTRIALDEYLNNLGLRLSQDDIKIIINADQGDAEAQYELALILVEISKLERAIPWLRISANRGCPDAMFFLGEMMIDGSGGSQDLKAGWDWIRLAAINGHGLAKRVLQLI